MTSIQILADLQDNRCVYCNRDMLRDCVPSRSPTREHLIPRDQGGGEGLNIVAACYTCNNRRGSQNLALWVYHACPRGAAARIRKSVIARAADHEREAVMAHLDAILSVPRSPVFTYDVRRPASIIL